MHLAGHMRPAGRVFETPALEPPVLEVESFPDVNLGFSRALYLTEELNMISILKNLYRLLILSWIFQKTTPGTLFQIF